MDTSITIDTQAESETYLTKQLLTYIGNKRSLLGFIGEGVALVKQRLGKDKLDIFEPFSGTGAVSRFLKQHAKTLIVNDLEKYAEVVSNCYLASPSESELRLLRGIYDSIIDEMDSAPLRSGFITDMYAPRDDKNIQRGERVFYTTRNANYIDTARQCMEDLSPYLRSFFLAPLLSEASIHTNTSGVFKGFFKNNGIGQFGGKNEDALSRIMGDITLPFPVFSNFDCEVVVHRGDANEVVLNVPEVDLVYIDPPYNQHSFGANYFLLNLITEYKRPTKTSPVSGIPVDWNRSAYNYKSTAAKAMKQLVESVRAKYLLISYNSEGYISLKEMTDMLAEIGTVEVLDTKYNAFRGSRNLSGRDIHVTEYLFLVKKI
ncbi:MAG: DNA adenine methylase [Spirochaetota bacterium]